MDADLGIVVKDIIVVFKLFKKYQTFGDGSESSRCNKTINSVPSIYELANDYQYQPTAKKFKHV